MNRDARNLAKCFFRLWLLLLAAGCATTTAKDGATYTGGEFFESEDFIVVVAKAGDTAQSLAGKFLGQASKDWMIEDYNGSAQISAGQAVVIPKRYWNIAGVDSSGYQLVPILCYHNIAPQARGRLTIAVKTFEEQMGYLKSQGYRVINLKEFVEFVSLQRQLPKKSVVITFDDGYKSFLQYAQPILNKFGFSATLFVYTDYVGMGGNALTWPDLKKLLQDGFNIEGHSKSHSNLKRTSGESAAEYNKRLTAELSQSRDIFQKNLGHTPAILAYPFGAQDDTVVQRTKEAGYTAAFTVRPQANPSFVERLRIHRTQIFSEMTLDDFAKYLNLFNQEKLQ